GISQLNRIDCDPACVAGAVERVDEIEPTDVAASHLDRFRPTLRAERCVTAADVTYQVSEARENFIAAPSITKHSHRIQIDAKPRAACGAQGAIQRAEI